MFTSNSPDFPKLTPRESEVIILLAAGLKKEEIAQQLGNKPSTVEKQISSACKRLNCRSSCQAICKLLQFKKIKI
jgi:DNA-binding NarL/FixJ family response regulator